MPRSREDKRRAVTTVLNDPEWCQWSDREIARGCFVSHDFVNRLRKSICHLMTDTKLNNSVPSICHLMTDTELNKERKAQRRGKEYTINTSKIGKKLALYSDNKRITVKDDHPLFAGESGTIIDYPNPDSAIVQLDNGNRELIHLKDFNMEQSFDADKPELAHHLKLVSGGLVQIYAPKNDRINGRLGRIKSVGASTVQVWVRDVERMVMHYHMLNHQQVEVVPIEEEPQLFEVCKRLLRLRQFSLDPFEVSILNLLDERIVFTPMELKYLSQIEQRYSIF